MTPPCGEYWFHLCFSFWSLHLSVVMSAREILHSVVCRIFVGNLLEGQCNNFSCHVSDVGAFRYLFAVFLSHLCKLLWRASAAESMQKSPAIIRISSKIRLLKGNVWLFCLPLSFNSMQNFYVSKMILSFESLVKKLRRMWNAWNSGLPVIATV